MAVLVFPPGLTGKERCPHDSYFRTETLSIGKDIPSNLSEAYTVIYERISSKEFKKTEFAMDLLATKSRWTVPAYIAEGLRWLELRLRGEQAPQHPQEATPEAGVTT